MEEEILFACEMCGFSFPADPDCMITITFSSYSVNEKSMILDISWEGISIPTNNLENFTNQIKIEAPEELSNSAICLCKMCQVKLLPVHTTEVENDD
jgi:hypothetical protein